MRTWAPPSLPLGPDAPINEQKAAVEIVASVREYRDSQDVLRAVLTAFGVKVFGAVLLNAIEAEDSLAGHAESMSCFPSLRTMGVMVRDLGRPQEVLSVGYREDAVAGYGPCSFRDALGNPPS